ncbi:MAG: hypothetical protein KDC46_13965 [Thermoleophilia bacterium]|nr:hypothetical protein [Thermoleophilia bacterium]
MLLSATHNVPMPDRASTQRMFNDLALSMSRSDAELEDAVHRGNRVGSGWDSWFKRTSEQLLDARDAYVQLNPQDLELGHRLAKDALDLSASGGQLYAAYTSGHTFGRGWDTTLDSKIADVRLAADRLFGAPNPGGPVDPTFPGSGVTDAARAARDLVSRSLDVIRSMPANDRGSEQTKQARLDAFHLNKQAQDLLEPHFDTADQATVSQLRTADASLEDAAWQLAKKPSPDGRFNGVDIPGAIRDTETALHVLDELTASRG